MIYIIPYKNINIRYSDIGQGKVIILLHGYLEALEIWSDFAESLSTDFRVISIDLPGHGQTGSFENENSMEVMADVVNAVVEAAKVDKCTMFGHSMGGYVLMAFVEKYSEKLNAFSLFHSAPYADNGEKKDNRDRIIKLIEQGKKAQVYNSHVPMIFANENGQKFAKDMESIKNIAKQTTDKGVIATLNGMRNRKDRAEILKKSNLPFLYILGLKDNFISVTILETLEMPANSQTLILENSGHIGFVEEKEKALDGVKTFVNNI